MKFRVDLYLLLLGMISIPILVNCWKPKKTYSSYRPSIFCKPSDYMRYPKNSDEVVEIVKEAIKRGVKVKAFGSRYSTTDIICTNGIPVDMREIKFCRMNDDGTATIGAGAKLGDIGKTLYQHDRALKVTPAFDDLTLGGALGTGAHGSSMKHNSTISQLVINMTVVNGRGHKIVISDPEDLKSFKVHLGLLGIIVDVTLTTVPLYKISAHNYVVPDFVLTNGDAVKWAKTQDQINFWWFPTFKQVVVANLTFVDVGTPGIAHTHSIVPSTYGQLNKIFSKTKELAYSLSSSTCAPASALGNTIGHVFEISTLSSLTKNTLGFAPIYTEDGRNVVNPAVGYAHSMLATSCNEGDAGILGAGCLWAHGDLKSNITILENEMAMAIDDLPQIINEIKDITKKTSTAFPLHGIRITFSGKNDIYMAQAYQRDTMHISFLLMERKDRYRQASGGLAGYQTILQTLAHKFKGRSHWGKTGAAYHSKEMIILKLDKNAREKFVAAMGKFDPDQTFFNNFALRLIQNGTKIDLDPKTKRCALLDNCFCSKDGECGRAQICATLPDYEYRVCKTKNEVNVTQFDTNLFPDANHVLNWFSTTLPTMVKAVESKCPILPMLFHTLPNVLRALKGKD